MSLDLAEHLSLDALSEEAQEHLLASMFGGSEVPEQVVSAVHEAAGGNPFLIEQTVQGLLRSGALFYEGGKWRVAG